MKICYVISLNRKYFLCVSVYLKCDKNGKIGGNEREITNLKEEKKNGGGHEKNFPIFLIG